MYRYLIFQPPNKNHTGTDQMDVESCEIWQAGDVDSPCIGLA